jgi:hypothetical protein
MNSESVFNGMTYGNARTTAALGRVWAALQWVGLPFVMLLGFLLRLAAARSLPQHFDEGAMLLGVHAVAERGVPLLPSGALYLHGATHSYLLAPLVWLGWGDLDDLFFLRAASAVLGAVTVYLTYRLALAVVGSTATALLAATLVALDPLSVVWGGWLRMYALEQMLAVVVAWLFVRQVGPEAGTATPFQQRRELTGLVAAFWLAVFAQVGAALLWPGMAVAAALLHGRALIGPRRALSVALGLCALAPVAFVAMSTWRGASPQQSEPLPVGSFIGDYLVNLRGVPQPEPAAWTVLFGVGALAGIVPWLVCLLSVILVIFVVRAHLAAGRDERARWRPIAAMLLLYWVPVLIAIAVATTPRARYLIFLQPLGYVLVAAAVALPWTSVVRFAAPSWRPRLFGAAAIGLTLLLLIHLGDGLRQLGDVAEREQAVTNRAEALAYVAAHRDPGDPVFVGWPPDAYLMLGKLPEIRVLGPIAMGRGASGENTDFWIGWPVTNILLGNRNEIRALDPTATERGAGGENDVTDPCSFLADHPGAWFVLEPYLSNSRALRYLAEGTADVVFPQPGDVRGDGTLVLRAPPSDSWDRKAVKACHDRVRAARDR